MSYYMIFFLMMVPQMTTGHIFFLDRGWATVIVFCLFFWKRNVMDTVSVNRMSGFDLSFISTLFLKNQISLIINHLVFRVYVTVRYSQLRMPKKNALFASCPRASFRGVKLFSINFLKTNSGGAFSCFVAGSASIQPLDCLVKNNDTFLSGSNAGSSHKIVRKVKSTFVMVDVTVFPRSIDFCDVPYSFLLQLLANAERI